MSVEVSYVDLTISSLIAVVLYAATYLSFVRLLRFPRNWFRPSLLASLITAGLVAVTVSYVSVSREGLSNLTSGLLDLCRSVILAFPFNIRFFSAGPLVVDFDEHGANQAFE